jgi:transposase
VARRTFAALDVVAILKLWYSGEPLSRVSLMLGVDRKTVKKYVQPAVSAGLTPGGTALADEQWTGLIRDAFPELLDDRVRQPTWSQLDRHYDYIQSALAALPQSSIWRYLRDEHDVRCSVASFRRYVAANFADACPRTNGTGPTGQIVFDWLGGWTDPQTRQARPVWAFVMVLARSRHLFLRPVLDIDVHAWRDAHVAAFEFFGGAPHRLVPFHLRGEARRLWHSSANPPYRRLARRYGVQISDDPSGTDNGGRVEVMAYIRARFWQDQEFGSPAAMRSVAEVWSREVAGRRPVPGLRGVTPLQAFERDERARLLTLPQPADDRLS